MTGEVIIDGTLLSWQAFADRLMALNAAPEQQASFGYARAPKGCGCEARRLLRSLDLEDRVALIAEEPDACRSRSTQGRIRDLVGSALTAIRAPMAPRPRPFRD